MIIDSSYFIGQISIPNLNSPGTLQRVNDILARTEKELLQGVLGYELYNLLMANLTVQKYKDIIEGKVFTFDYKGKTITRGWNGFKNADKISPIAYLAYYNYIRDTVSSTTGVGEVLAAVENSTPASSMNKLVQAYNRHIELLGGSVEDSTLHYDTEPTLYNFMVANAATYPQWDFNGKKFINVFGF